MSGGTMSTILLQQLLAVSLGQQVNFVEFTAVLSC